MRGKRAGQRSQEVAGDRARKKESSEARAGRILPAWTRGESAEHGAKRYDDRHVALVDTAACHCTPTNRRYRPCGGQGSDRRRDQARALGCDDTPGGSAATLASSGLPRGRTGRRAGVPSMMAWPHSGAKAVRFRRTRRAPGASARPGKNPGTGSSPRKGCTSAPRALSCAPCHCEPNRGAVVDELLRRPEQASLST